MKKYTALRFVGSLHKIVGALVIGVGALAFFTGFSRVSTYDPAVPYANYVGLGVALACFVWGMIIFAFGELIYLLIDIEENTRTSRAERSRAATAG